MEDLNVVFHFDIKKQIEWTYILMLDTQPHAEHGNECGGSKVTVQVEQEIPNKVNIIIHDRIKFGGDVHIS